MQIVAIDFSLNSPGIVIRKENELKFISYIKVGIGTKAETKMQEELAMLDDIILQFQPTFTTSKDFSDKEISKLQRFITMANDMILLIEQHVSVKDPIIFGFEGVSYGSGGGGTNNLIDLAAAAAIFKYLPSPFTIQQCGISAYFLNRLPSITKCCGATINFSIARCMAKKEAFKMLIWSISS